MKRIGSVVSAIFLAASLASPSFAQNLTAGAKIGFGFANLGGDFEDLIGTSTDLKTGISFGGFLGADVHRMFRLQGELQYVQKGAKAEEGGVEGTFTVNYLEVLVPLTLLIPVEGGVVPRLYVGPSLAFELDCKVKEEGDGISAEADCDSEEVGAPTKSIDYGIFFGGGIDIPVGPGAITFDALYNLGLGDIADEDETDPLLDISNSNIQILVGYGFRIGP